MSKKRDSSPDGASSVAATSRWMAAARARESERTDRLFCDPLAAVLAGPEGFEWLQDMEAAAGSDVPGRYPVIRTRFFDDFVLDACQRLGVRQVVLAAAGLDTRAFRLQWPARTRRACSITWRDPRCTPSRAGALAHRRRQPPRIGPDEPRPVLLPAGVADADRARPTRSPGTVRDKYSRDFDRAGSLGPAPARDQPRERHRDHQRAAVEDVRSVGFGVSLMIAIVGTDQGGASPGDVVAAARSERWLRSGASDDARAAVSGSRLQSGHHEARLLAVA
jgi:Leucine carboxyl methyltransferase